MNPHHETDSRNAAGRPEDCADHFSPVDQTPGPGAPHSPRAALSLIDKHLNAALTAAEAAALAQALSENPALADEFAAATRMECDLRMDCKEQAHTALYTRRMERAAEETGAPAARRRSWGKPLAAAAGVALLAGGGMALLEFRQHSVVQPESPPRGKVSRVPTLIAEASTAAAGEAPRGGAAAMKRKLRRFVAGSSPLRGLPVSQALSSLESQWKSFDHRDPKEKEAVAFTIAGAVLKTWANPDDEPRVNLEIPGISLLTSVELIAAQAGLRAAVTPAGVTLEPEKRADDGKPRTWNLPLPAETFTAFLARAGSETERTRQQIAQNSLTSSFSLLPMMEQAEPSWMRRKLSTRELVWDRTNVGIGGLVREDVKTGWEEITSFTGREFIYTTEFDPPQMPALPNHAWTEPPVDSTGKPMQTIDDLIADASRVQQTQASGFETRYDPTVLEVEAALPQDENGWTIDLNLAPEIIEFEGFLNYGSPIQTTGINALGESEPVVLTDSKITQPVFATRTLPDHPATLTQLLVAHGANTAGITWDETNGTVTARGSLGELRTASAVLSAVRESAAAGVSLECKVLEWKDAVPSSDDGSSMVLTAHQASALTRDAAGTVVSYPRVLSGAGSPVQVNSTVAQPLPDGSTTSVGLQLTARDFQPAGLSLGLSVEISSSAVTGSESKEGAPWPVIARSSSSSTASLREGEWLRFDFPASGDRKATTVLVSAQPVVLP